MAGFRKAKGELMKLFTYLTNKNHKDLLLLDAAYGVVGVFIFALAIYVSLPMREYFDVRAGFSFAYLPVYSIAFAYSYGAGILSTVNAKTYRLWNMILPRIFWLAIISFMVIIVIPRVYYSDHVYESIAFSIFSFWGFNRGDMWVEGIYMKALKKHLDEQSITS